MDRHRRRPAARDSRIVFRVAAVAVAAVLLHCAVGAADHAGEQLDFADSLYVREMYDMAAEEYGKYIEIDSDGAGAELAYFRMAECYYHLKRYPETATACERLIAKFPTGEKAKPATRRLGEIQFRLGDYSKAVATLETLLGGEVDEPVAAAALYYLGKAAFADGDARKSVATFTRLVTDYRGSELVPYGRFALAVAYYALGDYDHAAEHFTAVGSETSVPAAVRAESMFKTGMVYSESGLFDKARAALADTAATFPSSPVAEQARYEQAWAAYHGGKFEEANRLADTFIAKHRDGTWNVGAVYLKGKCYQSLSKHAEAERVYKGILAAHPSSPFAIRADCQLCWTAYWQSRYDEAATRAESVAERADAELRGEVLFVHGLARFAQDRFADALERFKTVVAGHPHSKFAPEAAFHYAQCLAELGRHDEAAQAFSRYGSGLPKNSLAAEAQFNAAQQQFLAGEYTAAAARFAKLATDATDTSARRNARFMEGRANQYAGQTETALKAYTAYLESYPAGLDAAEVLYQSGVIWQQQKEDGAAVGAYDKLVAEHPKSRFVSKALRNLGYIHYDNGDMDKAAMAFRGLLDGGSQVALRPDTLVWLANYLYDHKDYTAGRTAYEQYAKAGSAVTKKEFARVRTAECAFKTGDMAAAAAGYRAVIDAAPEGAYSVVAQLGLGSVLLATDQTDEAVDQLARVVEVGDPSAVAEARALLGDAYTKLDNLDEALRSYMMVAMVYDHPELSSRCYIKAADILGKRGERASEQKLYQDLLAAYPDSADASIARARLDGGRDNGESQ